LAIVGVALALAGCGGSGGGPDASAIGDLLNGLASAIPSVPDASVGEVNTPATVAGQFTLVDAAHDKTAAVDSQYTWTLTIDVKLKLKEPVPGGGGQYIDNGSTYTITGTAHQEVKDDYCGKVVEDVVWDSNGPLQTSDHRGATGMLDFDYAKNAWVFSFGAGADHARGAHTGHWSCFDEYEAGATVPPYGRPGFPECADVLDGSGVFPVSVACLTTRAPDTLVSLTGTLTGQ
jgi:hypothetical protein